MPMKRLVLLFALLLTTVVVMAQELRTVRGRVLDENGAPLSAASIVVAGTHTATVSNDDGYFTIKVPESARQIMVSHLSYQSETVSIEAGKTLKVKLKSKAVVLNELLVGDPQDILALALRNIPDNYLITPSLQTCFYREMTRKGNRFIYVAEAVTDIYKTAYEHEIAQDRVAIRKARRLISTSLKDTLGAKIAGGPVIPINLDIVKNRSYLLNFTHLSNYSFSMKPSANTTDGRNEMIITITPKVKAESAFLMGDFYIDVNSLAITHIDLQLDMSDRDNAVRFMLERKPLGVKFRPREFRVSIDYRPDSSGRLFLGYIRTDISFKCDWKRKLFSSPYHVTSEMVVTDLRTENVKPVRGRQIFLTHESLYDKVELFSDPAFWQKYNIIEPTESLEKGIERLKKKKGDS